jgi:hypothetical protein
MKLAAKIAVAALAGLGVAAIDAQARDKADTPAPVRELAPLSPDQVRTVVDGMLILKRSDLKVGAVTEKDDKTYSVELLKPDGSAAETTVVDKHFARPSGALAGIGKGPHGPHMRGHDGERGPGKHDGMFRGEREKPLTAAQVKDIIEGRIAMRGEDMTVGKVTEKDADTWQAEILAADGKLARTILVDKKSGRFMPKRG